MFIYVIKETGTDYYKIGISMHPDKRLKQAQTFNPRKLVLLNTYNVKTRDIAFKIEYQLHHKMFNFNHIRGEWFKLTQEHLNILNDWIISYV